MNKFIKKLKQKINIESLISFILLINLLFTRFYMLGIDIVSRDAFHFKNWSYVFMKEFEAGNWDKLFVTIQPGVLTIYTNIIGFKSLYFLKDKLNWITLEGKDLELLLHIFQKVPLTILIIILSVLIFCLLKKLFGYWVAALFITIYTFEPFFIILSRYIQTDALQALLIVASILSIFVWHKGKNFNFFYLSSILAGLGFIEKSSTVALIPFMGIVLAYLLFNNKKDITNKSVYISLFIKFISFTIIFFTTAAIFFPAYWKYPIETFNRMTIDAYIHGVGGVNLDSYDFVRPDDLGNPVKFSLDLSLLQYIIYNHTLEFIIGILLMIYTSIVLIKKQKLKGLFKYLLKPNVKYAIILVAFSFFYFAIIQISNLKMNRYIIVVSLPLTVISALGYYHFVEKYNNKVKVYLIILLSIIGLIRFMYYAPDWGAYHNILGSITNNTASFAGGTGNYKLGQYLTKNLDHNKSVMIADYTSLYLYYPGTVIDYDINKIKDIDYVITTKEDKALYDFGLEETNQYNKFDNIHFIIYERK